MTVRERMSDFLHSYIMCASDCATKSCTDCLYSISHMVCTALYQDSCNVTIACVHFL